MILADTAIKRPVFTAMVIAACLVLGIFGYNMMSVDLFPNVEFPFIVINTMYPGAGPEAIESEVTKPIEEAVNTVSAIDHLYSTSYEGLSVVIVRFELNTDPAEKAAEVREKVSAIRATLPQGIEEPVIQRFDPESAPFMSLTISGPRPLKELTTLTKNVIVKRLESVDGVGSVGLVGGAEREIQLVLNRQRMEAFDISVQQVIGAVQSANLEIPGGRIERGRSEWTIRTLGKITDWRKFRDLEVARRQGKPVYVKDIAAVLDGIQERRSLAFYDGQEAVGLDVIRRVGANTVKVARLVQERITELRRELPPDVKIAVANDNSLFIKDAVADVISNIEIGGALAVLVIFLFLASWRATLISGLSIPISITAAFFGMYLLDFSINFMSLLGLSIAVGFLIDDAIVVIENIYRHYHGGEPPKVAASRATSEIGLAVLATTLVVIVVFLPISYMGGIVGQYFHQFGVTVVLSIAFSMFVAFTLTPMLFPVLERRRVAAVAGARPGAEGKKGRPAGLGAGFEKWYDRVAAVYQRFLALSLRHRLLVSLIALVVFAASLAIGGLVGVEFFPQQDEAKMYLAFEAPPGTKLEESHRAAAQMEQLVRQYPEVKHIYTTIGAGQRDVNKGQIVAVLTPRSERERSVFAVIDDLRRQVKTLPGLFTSLSAQPVDGHGGRAVEISIVGEDLSVLAELAAAVEDSVKTVPNTVDVKNSLEGGRPELQLEIDRARAGELGINVYTLASTLNYLVGGDEITTYKEGDEEYDVLVRLDEQDRRNPWDIATLKIVSEKEIPGRDHFFVPLNQVTRVVERSGPVEINRYDRRRQVMVSANVSGAFAGDVREAAMKKIGGIPTPPGYEINATGEAEWQAESFQRIFLALFASIIFMYMVLASQYESFVDPLSIMVSLPLALVGAMLGLLIGGTSVSIISLIGVVLLMGLVSKNAILLIDFVKQARRAGDDRTTAILKAGPIRLRPILMTALTTILGLVPLALGLGEGAELRKPMAHAVIGGMISSTLLTLIVVPVVYTIIEDFFGLFRRKRKHAAESAASPTAVS